MSLQRKLVFSVKWDMRFSAKSEDEGRVAHLRKDEGASQQGSGPTRGNLRQPSSIPRGGLNPNWTQSHQPSSGTRSVGVHWAVVGRRQRMGPEGRGLLGECFRGKKVEALGIFGDV